MNRPVVFKIDLPVIPMSIIGKPRQNFEHNIDNFLLDFRMNDQEIASLTING